MITGFVQQGHRAVRRWALNPAVQRGARWGAYALAGFCLSAASLEQGALPLAAGLVWACRGWAAALAALGSVVGYGIFWRTAGLSGVVWTALALVGVLTLGERRICREVKLLLPSLGMLSVSATGLVFQLLGDTTGIWLHLLRVALGGATPWLFTRALGKEDPVSRWLGWGLFALGLGQIAPMPWLGLGFVAAGLMTAAGPFPCAAVVGLALDLARITAVPMTAVTVLAYLPRFLPRQNKAFLGIAPFAVAVMGMRLCGRWDPMVLPGLLAGGVLGAFWPDRETLPFRRGETGAAQVHLEMAAQVLTQTQKLLLEIPETPVDGDALVARSIELACMDCPQSKGCRDARRLNRLSGEVLDLPLLSWEELPVRCRKPERLLSQLQRGQQQYRAIRADRQRQQEYRQAVIQQYQFLGGFLQDLSDRLTRRERYVRPMYAPKVSVYANRPRQDNADLCMQFPGVGNAYYIILCDGMGSGPGALQEAKTAAGMLRKLLTSGFPTEDALGSLNSLCALRERAGAVTVDLVCLELGSGKAAVYKWGAAASYLLDGSSVQKLGAVNPPPGIQVTDKRHSCCQVTLRREQTMLLLVSDGLEESRVLQACRGQPTPQALAGALLENTRTEGEDDATLVTIQLQMARSG